jgi:hypothetical protein
MATLIGSLTVVLTAVMALSNTAVAWNIPGHMLSAIIAYQALQQENPLTIEKVKAVLEKHPRYANQWQARVQDVPIAERDQVLFIQAARWPDDIRIQDKAQNRPSWHYINLPFKPEGQPDSVQIREPEAVNILTALAENESVVKNENDPERRQLRSRGSFTLWATCTSLCTRHSYSPLTSAKRKGHRNPQGRYYFSQQGYGRGLPRL